MGHFHGLCTGGIDLMKRYVARLCGGFGLFALAAMPVGAVTLSNVVRADGQLQFTLTGSSNAIYIIEGSTSLLQWSGVLTNREVAVTRTVTVNMTQPRSYYRARVARTFSAAIISAGTIDLQGNNIIVDSFDSGNTNYSTSGLYDPIKRSDGGDIATHSGLTNSVNVGNARIYGKLLTGPGGSASIGAQGGVGSILFLDNPANAGGIEPGWFRDDFEISFPNVSRPPSSLPYYPMGPGFIGGASYAYLLQSYNYLYPNLSMSSGTMMVAGHALLWVVNISISGTAKIVIAPSASLRLYVGGTASFSGDGIINQTGTALGFQYYGFAGNTSVRLVNNGSFAGTICAPNADLVFYAGGSSAFDISGAIIGRSVTFSGPFKVHYDEALARSGPAF
jgi:hypothetical protein